MGSRGDTLLPAGGDVMTTDATETRTLHTVARAKLNLALHVRGRRSDGYHDLDSVFVHTVDGDVLTFAGADSVSLTIDGPYGQGLSADADNLIVRAAHALQAEFADVRTAQAKAQLSWVPAGAAIHLTKHLPLASGIGGGSSDAAATIMTLTDLWELPDDYDRMRAVAAALGADVAPCLVPWPKHVTGRGEDFVALDDRGYRHRPVLLVNPGVALSTAAVFAGWDGIDHGPIAEPQCFDAVMAQGRNDLTASAIALAPVIGEVLAALAQNGARWRRMSGSGATCWGMFESDGARDAAADAIRRAQPDWWVMATRLF